MEHFTLWAADVYLRLQRAMQRQEGQTMAEYALILALVAVVAIGAFKLLGSNVKSRVSDIASQVGSP